MIEHVTQLQVYLSPISAQSEPPDTEKPKTVWQFIKDDFEKYKKNQLYKMRDLYELFVDGWFPPGSTKKKSKRDTAAAENLDYNTFSRKNESDEGRKENDGNIRMMEKQKFVEVEPLEEEIVPLRKLERFVRNNDDIHGALLNSENGENIRNENSTTDIIPEKQLLKRYIRNDIKRFLDNLKSFIEDAIEGEDGVSENVSASIYRDIDEYATTQAYDSDDDTRNQTRIKRVCPCTCDEKNSKEDYIADVPEELKPLSRKI
ncbi:hypothetical protein HHI36_013959 [Cryptolaemus montrouzieri]|uniref:MADF domain-containing protein n=1 Tax=Cryptolaemus montrouzieri TaxID=559131 RepID=A0ABD2N2E4_9CUCU